MDDKYNELLDKIEALQNELNYLYHENVETTNRLYELENRIDSLSTPVAQYNPVPVDTRKTVTFTEADFI